MTDTTFVRSQLIDSSPAPSNSTGAMAWARQNLFATPVDSALTLVALAFLFWTLPPLFDFIVGSAVWPGGTVEDCRVQGAGACWAYIGSEIEFFIYGFYPAEEFWRVNIVFALFAALLIPILIPSAPFKRLNSFLIFVFFPVVSFFLLIGLAIPVGEDHAWYETLSGMDLLHKPITANDDTLYFMQHVPTENWGGLLVTLIMSVVGITLSFPLGILLALGRQSDLPVIKSLCVMFIELIRAVPLITILFMASIMLPLFMPQGATIDKFMRALVGVTLFSAAYMAEVVRGGLQALPRGQYEAASALGLSYWKSMFFIVLPQALKHVIPGIVNNFIALFKDTSLVYIVGMKDLLEAVKTKNDALEWASAQTSITGYLFAGMVFWAFCFAMSRYSMFMERRLDTGHKE